MIISAILLVSSFTQYSFALGDYDPISEWGEFGIKAPGHFSYPQFIAVDGDGNSYVSDLGNKRIPRPNKIGIPPSETPVINSRTSNIV